MWQSSLGICYLRVCLANQAHNTFFSGGKLLLGFFFDFEFSLIDGKLESTIICKLATKGELNYWKSV